MPINLTILVSGSGSTLQNLIDAIDQKQLDARIGLVIGSRDGLAAEARAAKAMIRYEVVRRKEYDALSAFSERIWQLARSVDTDLVCCAGWLALLELDPAFQQRVINVHPSLLPSFGGKGMYGRHVHEAVLAHGCKVSGCTVHFVDDQYDNGPILLQRTCAVLDTDTPETLAERVQCEERLAFPEAIRLIQKGRVKVDGRRVYINRA